MAAETVTESGLQLISRIHSKLRPCLAKLAPEILAHSGPHSCEVIEIGGQSNVGKSILLLELISAAIIPLEHGGRGADSILVDLTANFSIINLMPILEKHILHHRMLAVSDGETEDLRYTIGDDVTAVIELALNNLQVIQCYTTDEFERTLWQIRSSFSMNPQLALLAIESLGAYYWNDISADQPMRMDTYMRKQIKSVRKITDDHGIVLTYTRPAHFPPSFEQGRQEKVDYVVKLSAVGGNDGFNATAVAGDSVLEARYTIHGNGIHWEYTKT